MKILEIVFTSLDILVDKLIKRAFACLCHPLDGANELDTLCVSHRIYVMR